MNIPKLKEYMQPFFDLIKESEASYFWVAGGAIRDYFVTGGATLKDIDIFFPNAKERDKAIKYLKWKQFKVMRELPRDRGAVFNLTRGSVPDKYSHLAQGGKYNYHSMDIGCWDGKSGESNYSSTPQECIDWFDFSVEMGALDSEGNTFFASSYERDIKNKILTRNSMRQGYPRANNTRFLKYVKQGFTIDQENLLLWLEDQDATFEYRRNINKNKTK